MGSPTRVICPGLLYSDQQSACLKGSTLVSTVTGDGYLAVGEAIYRLHLVRVPALRPAACFRAGIPPGFLQLWPTTSGNTLMFYGYRIFLVGGNGNCWAESQTLDKWWPGSNLHLPRSVGKSVIRIGSMTLGHIQFINAIEFQAV